MAHLTIFVREFNRREQWFGVHGAIADRANTLDYQDGECPWITLMQEIEDPREYERRRTLLSAPELLSCDNALYSFARPTPDTPPQAQRELREAEKLIDRLKTTLVRLYAQRD